MRLIEGPGNTYPDKKYLKDELIAAVKLKVQMGQRRSRISQFTSGRGKKNYWEL